MTLWDRAEPISLDEIRARFAALARHDLAYKPVQSALDNEVLTLDELWKIFESLEELDDWPVIS